MSFYFGSAASAFTQDVSVVSPSLINSTVFLSLAQLYNLYASNHPGLMSPFLICGNIP
jgi:hypothetical protein